LGVRIADVFLETEEGEEKDRSSERKSKRKKKMGVEVGQATSFGLPAFSTGRAERLGFGTSHAERGGPRLPLRRPTCSWPVSVPAVPKPVVSARAVPTPRYFPNSWQTRAIFRISCLKKYYFKLLLNTNPTV
jgi:hypothetical protein